MISISRMDFSFFGKQKICFLGINFTLTEKMSGGKKKNLKGNEIQFSLEKQLR